MDPASLSSLPLLCLHVCVCAWTRTLDRVRTRPLSPFMVKEEGGASFRGREEGMDDRLSDLGTPDTMTTHSGTKQSVHNSVSCGHHAER